MVKVRGNCVILWLEKMELGCKKSIKINETTFDGVKRSQFILYCAQLALSLQFKKNGKTMTTVVIDNTNPQAQDLLDYVRSFSFVKVIGNKTKKANAEEVFERIPGLAYTQEERIASVRKSMEDVRAGRVYSAEQVRAMFPRV